MNKFSKIKNVLIGAGTTAVGALMLGMNAVHAQVLSATDANTIVDSVQTEVGSFLTTTLPLVLIGLVILAWVFKMYHRVRRGA